MSISVILQGGSGCGFVCSVSVRILLLILVMHVVPRVTAVSFGGIIHWEWGWGQGRGVSSLVWVDVACYGVVFGEMQDLQGL